MTYVRSLAVVLLALACTFGAVHYASATETPVATGTQVSPVATDVPVATGTQVAPDAPVAADAPVATDVTGNPVATDAPVTPVVTDVTGNNPVVTEVTATTAGAADVTATVSASYPVITRVEPAAAAGPYKPDWTSLDSRPLPAWYDQAKFGIFIHWGVFSVPSYGGEWFWINWRGRKIANYVNFMRKNYKPGFTYHDFGPQFTAEFFDPMAWANIFKDSGAKYVVLTAKHHEGYTLWPSKSAFGWNSVDVGPHRDLVGDLSKAVRSLNATRFGVYSSMFEWFNPLWMQDKESNLTTRNFVTNKVLPELYDLVNKYKPEIVWSDGEWEAPATYWDSLNFLSWLYNESPVKDTVVVNDRWGGDTLCKHGGFLTCADRYQPGKLVSRKWENAMTIDKYTWGYRRNSRALDVYSIEELIYQLVETVSLGGNLLLNISPTVDGMIPPLHEERLLQIGQWLSSNGEAIFNTRSWDKCQVDTQNPQLWYTQGNSSSVIYSTFLKWPVDNLLNSACLDKLNIESIFMLDTQSELKWNSKPDGGLVIQLGDKSKVKTEWGWALRITLNK